MMLPEVRSTNRVDFIERYARGKRVLHIGCADVPFTQDRLTRGELLHQRLHACAGQLDGVDLSEEGIGIMRAAGFKNLYVADCEKPLSASTPGNYDVVIAGETLEHVMNAGDFLASLKSVCRRDGRIIITTPNNASIKLNLRLFKRIENVHPEHVAYYSYSTLSRLFSMAGLEPTDWGVYWAEKSAQSRVANSVLRSMSRLRYFADGFCVACRPLA
ncbi:class I SAM-dependent methyltransferase [Hansschlegelia quercus]|uniref:Class I SAM-dependent methyltransferase n=1 Tax=Hansschlegelia quercus TaxID=2528245 RepID=A0A4Q9GF47_9HYPH|nr:class I SAM-dependent methyltransferase [Hansschlegelia quercus]TBN47314.1 class I SAM-dependent methyltransferase [Hansschlegelia quercus]